MDRRIAAPDEGAWSWHRPLTLMASESAMSFLGRLAQAKAAPSIVAFCTDQGRRPDHDRLRDLYREHVLDTWPIERSTWDAASALSEDVLEHYWLDFSSHYIDGEQETLLAVSPTLCGVTAPSSRWSRS